jgi:hypothetical protein
VEDGVSFSETRKRLDSQSDILSRETTQSSGVSCGESSSESVASPASLTLQACPLPVSLVETHMILKDHAICAAGNTVHRHSTKTRIEKNERIVTTAPYKYKDEEVVTKSDKMFTWLSWRL